MGGDSEHKPLRWRFRSLKSARHELFREGRSVLTLLTVFAFLLWLTHSDTPPTTRTAPRRFLEESGVPQVVMSHTGPNVTFLSWHPRVILAQGFLSEEECAHVIDVAAKRMERSSVVSNGDGSSVVDSIRTSSGTFITHNEDKVVDRIMERISQFTMLPLENQEALQVLHYGTGEKYGAHMDTFHLPSMLTVESGLQRVATALMFLNTPTQGGETVFPNLDPAPGQDDGRSECAREGLSHKPKTGDMILFWSLSPSGEVDMGATHGACPVIEGEKWSAPLWIHQAPFQAEHKRVLHKECEDEHTLCRSWAKSGECDSNKRFMVGTTDEPGMCRRACNACPYPK